MKLGPHSRPLLLLLSLLPFVLVSRALSNPLDARRFPPGANTDPPELWATSRTIATGLSGIVSFRYTPDGTGLLVATDLGELALFDRASGRLAWKTKPFPESRNAIYVGDIHPDNRSFVTYTGLGASEDHYTLNFHEMGSGRITRTLTEESSFWQPRANKDHRRPDAAEIGERRAAGLGDYWVLVPRAARFVNGGQRLLVTWVNSMTGPDLYDREFVLYDSATLRRRFHYTIVSDKKNFDDDQPAGFRIGTPRPPVVPHPNGSDFIYGTPHARIHLLDDTTVQAAAGKAKVEEKSAGPEIANPRHPKPAYGDLAQAVSDLAVDPARGLLFAACGTGGEQFVYVYDLASRREVARSPEMHVEYIRLSADRNYLATMSRQIGETRVFNLTDGRLEFRAGGTVEWNPVLTEFAMLSGEGLALYQRK